MTEYVVYSTGKFARVLGEFKNEAEVRKRLRKVDDSNLRRYSVETWSTPMGHPSFDLEFRGVVSASEFLR